MDNKSWKASINNNAMPVVSYQVDQLFNDIGTIDGVSSARVIGSSNRVAFKHKKKQKDVFLVLETTIK